MTPGSVARRYATALYDLAVEDSVAEETNAALAEVAKAVGAFEPGVLGSGALSVEQRATVAQAIGSRFADAPLVAKFLGVVAAADRLECLPGIREHYGRLVDIAAGRVRAKIASATTLDGEAVEAIKKTFAAVSGCEVVPELSVDPALIGGVTVELEGRVYDGSLRSQLAKLEALMAGER